MTIIDLEVPLMEYPPMATLIPYAPTNERTKHTEKCFIEFLSMCINYLEYIRISDNGNK